MTEEELAAIVGRPLPGGEYVIEPYQDWLVRDILHTDVQGTCAHPLFAYIASAVGKGMAWDEVFALCGSSAADGPMFGEHETQLVRPLALGERLRTEGEFTTAVRKQGAKTGTFDIIGFEIRLIDEGGTVAAVTRSSVVYPRRSS
ncbi:MAG: hypothetical protein ACK5KO_01080 [Arachnia sp.]